MVRDAARMQGNVGNSAMPGSRGRPLHQRNSPDMGPAGLDRAALLVADPAGEPCRAFDESAAMEWAIFLRVGGLLCDGDADRMT